MTEAPIIHGKAHHEETRATASQTLTIPQGRYLVVLDRAEALIVCDDWLPRRGPLSIGLTAGASTPKNIIGRVVDTLAAFAAHA
jgi:4-hydroxy-3-methylbut-2-enyl diphosphate reductase IspH